MNRQKLVPVCALFAGLLAAVPAARAQVPTFEEVTGHAFGERATQHHQMVAYLQRLAEASPRVTVTVQGESWEGRELMLAVVTSPENHARLEEIQANSRRLADPRGTAPEEARTLMQTQPVVVWFGGSIHGFELSGAEGALKLLEHLTTQDDPATLEVLRNVVVLIDPMLNPDGREAFVRVNYENEGHAPNPDPQDWANSFTGWQALKFRTGHYYFDINRDWFAHTQRETRERMPFLHAWRAQVAVDMHEMGSGQEFFFDPPADPTNPYFPDFALRWFQRFGNAYAQAFDSAGFQYTTRELFNYFYPGYTSNRGYHGAVAMLYEQGSSRGHALERPDGTVRTLADALQHQYVAAWTAARTAATSREALLADYYASQQAAIADGRQGVRRYLIANEGDPVLVRELGQLLRRNAIEVSVLTQAVTLSGVRDREGTVVGRRSFPVGTYVVEAAQPSGRLVRALLEPDTPQPEAFLRDARARVDRGENPRFYDITGWSLPLLYNVGGYSSTDGRELPTEPLERPQLLIAPEPMERADYAYVLDGRSAASLAALYHLRHEGYRAGVLTKRSRVAGQVVHGGSVVIRVGENDSTVHEAVERVAGRFGVEVLAMHTGLSDSGYPPLGSGWHSFMVKKPEIAILAESPVFGYSFGWAWYTLDRQHGIPTTVLRTSAVAETDLSQYNVLVIPAVSGAALQRELGEQGTERISRWVRDGGTLVTIGSATEFAREQLDLIALRSWYDTDEGEDAQRIDVPGAIFRAALDQGYWLSAGYDAGEFPVLVDSDRLYVAPEGPPSTRRRVVARYGDKLSGHAWQENLDRMSEAVIVYEERVGDGRVIAFAEDPNYRAYFRAANRLFLNAVILGPSAP
ncbi:MAG: hypothetical protein JSW43_01270 [Gemmatimonadota bacterium]|nr:MAG: hypothetical protein JSW43_01270 [Gemmatimonadota bacterium]